MTIPTPDEVRAEQDPIRKSILGAILRICENRPLNVEPGSRSVVALAEEAGVKRHWLNQRHRDLRERFVFIRETLLEPVQPDDTDDRYLELQAQIDELKRRCDQVANERDKWKYSAQLFVRAMNVQEVELGRRDVTIQRLTRRLENASEREEDELAVKRHRRRQPDVQ